MVGMAGFPTQTLLDFWANVATIVAPLLAFAVYYHRRYTTRKRIASALIQEIRQNRYWARGQRPHYDQHGIVGLSDKFIYSDQDVDDPMNLSVLPSRVRVPNYDAGDIPPSARASSKVYESSASEVSRFDQDLAEDLVSYYHQLDFVMELNRIVHEGGELPPAGYSVLSDSMDDYVIENDDLVQELRIEMKRFPRLHRYLVVIKERTVRFSTRTKSRFLTQDSQ